MSPIQPISFSLLPLAVFIPYGDSFAQRRAGDLKVEPYVFENSKKEKIEAELGRLLVPENRSAPKSHLIELVFVRFKSTAKSPGPPIIYLAGGPGNSGIDQARGSRFPLFMAMREFGDVIALDQRGTGLSTPNLACREPLDFPLDAKTPVSNAEEVRKGFANGTHLIIDGAVHSDPLFLSSPKIKDVMMEFMRGVPVSTTRITLPPMKFIMRNPLGNN